MKQGIEEQLRVCFTGRDDILLAYLFGSATAGRLTTESDIDIAVLFRDRPDYSDILKLKDEISGIAGRDVDIVIMNDSSPIIRMQILKNGVLLHRKSESTYCNFFVRTVKEYDDLKYIRREAEEKILKGRIYA